MNTMNTKEIFLASPYFTDYDIGSGDDLLVSVRVTSTCYNGLKALGYVLTENDVKRAIRFLKLNGYTRAKVYGTYESVNEIMKTVGRTIYTANELREKERS